MKTMKSQNDMDLKMPDHFLQNTLTGSDTF
jgi:hypothetical protein